jgi:hypothetical protein
VGREAEEQPNDDRHHALQGDERARPYAGELIFLIGVLMVYCWFC